MIGKNVILVSHVALGGSVTLGDYVMIGGNAAVRDHVTIGDRAMGAGCCCISKDITPGLFVNGNPALDNREYLRQQAHVRRLPRDMKRLADLVRRVEELEQTIHNNK